MHVGAIMARERSAKMSAGGFLPAGRRTLVNRLRATGALQTCELLMGCIVMSALFSGLPGEAGAAAGDETGRSVVISQTAGGVRFGTWGERPAAPAPTLFIFSSTIEESLGNAYYRQCGNELAEKGYLCVSLDLPCHGKDERTDEPKGLSGWRDRAVKGEDFMAPMVTRAKKVLDHLIAEGYTDATKTAACGTSRGGFVAAHVAGADERVRCVAAFAPVTDLTGLREFHGTGENPLVRSLSLRQKADELAGRAVWLVIGDQDARVDTDRTIELARRITAASLAVKKESRVELHVMPDARGHAIPDSSAARAAAWITEQLAGSGKLNP